MTTPQRGTGSRLSRFVAVSISVIGMAWIVPSVALAQANPYPSMAPVEQYLMPGETQEIVLARSAAPASISAQAEVMVLSKRGYATAVKGTNGFVCVVVRSWDNNFSSADFWNPKTRSPICFNAASARTVLATYLMRTDWVLAGLTKTEMQTWDKSAIAAGTIKAAEPGSMSYMLSKSGYLGDDVHGPWHPHVMFFAPRTAAAQWGANLAGSPVMADDEGDDATTIFFVVVRNWSDGSADATAH
jgi:hypothetical protein